MMIIDGISDLTRSRLHVAAAEILGVEDVPAEEMTRVKRATAAYLDIIICQSVSPVTGLMALAIAESLRWQLVDGENVRIRVKDVVAAYRIEDGFQIDANEATLALRLLGFLRVGKHWQAEPGYVAQNFVPDAENVFEEVF